MLKHRLLTSEGVAGASRSILGIGGWVSKARSYPQLIIGGAVLLLLVIGALLAPILSAYSPVAPNPSEVLQPPSQAHLLGTDHLGRDTMSRILYGGRLTFLVVAGTIIISLGVGVPLGMVGGYVLGWTDGVIMRTMDSLLAIPGLVLALAIAFALGPSATTIVVALSVVQIPGFARLARAQILTLRRQEFVDAAILAGIPTHRIIFRHLLPNMADILLVQASVAAGQTIFTSASLSFLGLGIPPPAPDWGGMLREGYPYLSIAPLQAIIPGVFIFAAVLAFNFLGDGLRDLFDPRQRQRRGV